MFDLSESGLVHRRTLADPLLVSPNDVLAVGPDQLYVTNDHGSEGGIARMLEDYLRLPNANVLYFDGEEKIWPTPTASTSRTTAEGSSSHQSPTAKS